MPRGRKKTRAVPSVSKTTTASHANSDMVEKLYRQFDSILKKAKVPKREIANRVSMSYQGFLNSYHKKLLPLEKWVLISKFLNLPLTVQFELGNKAKTEPETTPLPLGNKEQKPSEYLPDIEKVAALEKYIVLLEDRLNDKEQIVSLLSSLK